MKKIKMISIISLIIMISILLLSCENENKVSYKDVSLGVIESTGYKDASYIHFYDDNLNYLYSEKVNHANLSEPFNYPIYNNGKLVAVPRGTFKERKEHCILEYDIKANSYRYWDTNIRAINSLAESKDYYFTVNTINAVSTISRNNKKNTDKEPLSKKYNNVIISNLTVFDETLYAIILDIKTQKTSFAELSIDTLKVKESYDTTELGTFNRMIKHGDNIIISNQYTDEFTGEPSTSLTVFNRKSKTFKQIDTGIEFPNDLFIVGNNLFISHYDLVNNQGNKVTIMDLSTNTFKTIELTHKVTQLTSDGKHIYVLDVTRESEMIYKYIYDKNQLTEIDRVKIKTQDSKDFYYISSMFIKK